MNIITTKESLFALALIEKEGAETAYINISVDCFAENTAKQTVLFVLYSDLLQSGAGSYTRDEFQRACDELGTNICVTTADSLMNVTLASLATKITPSLKLLEVMLTKPTFKPAEFKRAVLTLKNALEQSRENARGIAQTLLKNALFEKMSRQYGFLPDELLAVVDTVTLADIKNLHRELLLAYWTVSIGGAKKSLTAGTKMLNSVKNSSISPVPVYTKAKTNTRRTVVLHEVKSKQNIELSIGGSIPLTLQTPDSAAFSFGLAVLGKWGGFSGRLMSTVREKEGLTYGIYAKTEGITVSETGYWRIMTFFAPKDVAKGITSTLREVTAIGEKGITDSELLRFKTILKTSEALMFDSLTRTVNLVHGNLAAGLTWDEYQAFRKQFQALTKKEVNLALKNHLDPKNLVISAAGPVVNVKGDLQKFAG